MLFLYVVAIACSPEAKQSSQHTRTYLSKNDSGSLFWNNVMVNYNLWTKNSIGFLDFFKASVRLQHGS